MSRCPLLAQQLALSHLCPIPSCRNEVSVPLRPCRRDRALFGPYIRVIPNSDKETESEHHDIDWQSDA